MEDEWRIAIADYGAWQRTGGHSPETIALRVRYLTRLANQAPHPPFEMTVHDLVRFLDKPGWKPETRKSARAAMRGFYKWAMDVDLTTADPAYRLPAVHVPAGKPKPTPENIIELAMDRADARGQLMIMLGALEGLRRAEIAAVHSDNIVGTELRVTGKGGRTRVLPLDPDLAAALASAHGYVFPGRFGGHITPNHVGVILKRLLGPGYSAHTLRHRFASTSYAGNRDLRAVQEALGHSKPETTTRYTALPDGALRAAIDAAAFRKRSA